MKKIIALILCVWTVLSLCACKQQTPAETTVAAQKPAVTQPAVTEPEIPEQSDDGVLKILAIGNSFSVDAMYILYEIAQKEGYTDIELGNLYIGGCSVETHAKNIKTFAAEYTFYLNSKGNWTSIANTTVDFGLRHTDWDIITLQQASTYSGQEETYNQDIQTVVDYVNENKLNPNAKLYWHMTWAYPENAGNATLTSKYGDSQMQMYEAICAAVQNKIVTDPAFSGVIPVGTAIQNARTSFLRDTFNRDKSHLNDLGRVIAGYTWFCYLTGTTVDDPKLMEVPSFLKKSYEGAGAMPLSDWERKVIADAVKGALANPFAVTNSQYPPAE